MIFKISTPKKILTLSMLMFVGLSFSQNSQKKDSRESTTIRPVKEFTKANESISTTGTALAQNAIQSINPTNGYDV